MQTTTTSTQLATDYLTFIQAAINAAADRQPCSQCGAVVRLSTYEREGKYSLELCAPCTHEAVQQSWASLLSWPPTAEMKA